MTEPPERKIESHQLPRLLRAAAELQARAEGRPAESFTIAEVEQIAAEVGIPVNYVRRAAQFLQPIRENIVVGPLGHSALHSVEAHVHTQASPEAARVLLASAAAQLGMASVVYDEPMPGTWRIGSGRRAVVQVSPEATGTRIAILSDRRLLKAALLAAGAGVGAYVGAQVGFGVAIRAAEPLRAASYLLPLGGIAGGILGIISGRVTWQLQARAWYRRMKEVLANVIAEIRD